MISTGQLIWSDTFSGNMSKAQDHLAEESSVRAQPFLFSRTQKSGQMIVEGWKGCSQWCAESTTAVFLEVRAAFTFTAGNSVGTGLGLTSRWTFTEQLSNIRLFSSNA